VGTNQKSGNSRLFYFLPLNARIYKDGNKKVWWRQKESDF